MMALDQTAFVGFLPDREAGTRSPPCIDDFGIGSRPRTDPLEEVQDQGVEGIGHGHLLRRM
jgi:hypothetical protein